MILLAVSALAAAAIPLSTAPWMAPLLTASLLCLLPSTYVVFLLGRRIAARGRGAYDLAVVVALASAVPILYCLDVAGPLIGILAILLLLHDIQAPPRWGLLATLTVGAPHALMQYLVATGSLSRQTLLQVEPNRATELSNLGSLVVIYTLSFVMATLYRRRTDQHLAELAEAGKEIAARDALLREARLDLEQVAAIGDRGRFTEQRLGSFVLGHVLGRGGMGEIYEAASIVTGERAAVKLLRRPVGVSTGVLRRFEREAALVSTLESPHIVRILEVGGMEAAFPFIAMERLDGEDCAKLLERQGKLGPEQVVDLLSQLAEALAVAKKHGVVHRDIKPSNLFLTADGTWKVLDFGVGRLAGDAGSLTGGDTVGTVGYLAPEQLRSEAPVTHHTDLHAMGILAYRALTGVGPFVERDMWRLLRELERRLPVRPSTLAGVPREVDDVLLVALAKDPRDRFDDARELAGSFRDAIEGRITKDLQGRAAALERKLTWTESARNDQARTRSSQRTAPSANTTAPHDGPPPAPPTPTRPPEGAPTLRDAVVPAKPTLAGSTDEVLRSLTLARARVLGIPLVGAVLFAFTQLPLNTNPRMRVFGLVATLVLLGSILGIVFARATTVRALRVLHRSTFVALVAGTCLAYYFTPLGIVVAYIGLMLLIFQFGAAPAVSTAAVVMVATSHAVMHLAETFGVLEDRGIWQMHPTVAARLLNLAEALVLYAACLIAGREVSARSQQTLGQVSEAFRRLAEREALLRDARAELERAAGVGQPGRFTGQRFGSFVAGSILGRGGMGEVYEATRAVDGTRAAVKVLLRRAASDADLLARFEREARAVASLSSRHIVKVLEVGGAEGASLPYIAMERLDGTDLALLLQRRLLLKSAEVTDMVSQVAAGLEVASTGSITHLDIKPQNLFLTREGTWKILDFGVAAAGASRASGTETGGGTPAYMAPEQLEPDGDVEPRADLYALAVVTYRALTGRPAFSGRDAVTVLYRVMTSLPERPSSIVELPEAVDDILYLGMAKDAQHRFATAQDFASALDAAMRGEIEPALAARARRLQDRMPWGWRSANPVARGEKQEEEEPSARATPPH